MQVVSDVETDAVEYPKRWWLVGGLNLKTGERYQFENLDTDPVAKKAAAEWYRQCTMIVGHNFLQYDAKWLNLFYNQRVVDPAKVIDTIVISRLIDYDMPIPKGGDSPHSLKSWGIRLNCHKGDFHDFTKLTDEMREYWHGDLDTTEKLFWHLRRYMIDPEWKKAIRCEHDLTTEMVRTSIQGFHFNKPLAQELLDEVTADMDVLETAIRSDFPPKLVEDRRIQYRTKADGTEFATVQKARAGADMVKVDGDEMIIYNYQEFNPGSPKQRIEVLHEAGWKPYEKTKTHMKFARAKIGDMWGKQKLTEDLYNAKKENFETYGWAVNEDNLDTLPDDAPDGAKALAEWLTLEGRRSSLAEWIGQVKDDNRIHGSIISIGAWTGRCAHKNPNTANISSVFHGEAKTPVQMVKSRYDHRLRECWDVPQGSWLVGCDADGIQLRVLADYLWRYFDATEYADAIISGKKEDETDIHNVNKRALGLNSATRDDAKTFIYSWLLGAGVGKTASILRITTSQASLVRKNFEESIDGLAPLKRKLIPYIAKQGWFTGYDGRKVVVPSQHKTLAGILQSGESVLMKHCLLRWTQEARNEGINFKLVGFIHDEYQTEVIGPRQDAERLMEIQKAAFLKTGEELGFMIPTPGDARIGHNWKETH